MKVTINLFLSFLIVSMFILTSALVVHAQEAEETAAESTESNKVDTKEFKNDNGDDLSEEDEGSEDIVNEDSDEDEEEGGEEFAGEDEEDSDEFADADEEDSEEFADDEEDKEEVADETKDNEAKEVADKEDDDNFEDLSLDDEEEVGDEEVQQAEVVEEQGDDLEPMAEDEEPAQAEQEEFVEEEELESAKTSIEVEDDPDLAYEARLHQIYLDYYSQKMGSDTWNQIAGDRQNEMYEIREGDSLWEISRVLFGDGNYWPKVWSLNGRITNPHLIQPKNRIKFILGDEFDPPSFTITEPDVDSNEVTEVKEVKEVKSMISQSTPVSKESPEEDLEIPPPGFISRPPLRKLPPSFPEWQSALGGEVGQYDKYGISYARRPILDIKNTIPLTSYVQAETPSFLGKVSEVEAGSQMANTFQYVYLQMKTGEAKVGDKFLIIKNLGEIEVANKYVKGVNGYSIMIQGEVEITDKVNKLAEAQNGEFFRAIVTKIISPVSLGGLVVKGKIQLADLSLKGEKSNIVSQVIGGELFKKRQILGVESVAYLNRGSNDGLKVGQILPIRGNRKVRNSASIVLENLNPVGWIKIVKTTPLLSTGIIVKAIEGIYSGDYTGTGQVLEDHSGPIISRQSQVQSSEDTEFSDDVEEDEDSEFEDEDSEEEIDL